jgi:oxygen-independent coproporphyrinogen-3 oxidase
MSLVYCVNTFTLFAVTKPNQPTDDIIDQIDLSEEKRLKDNGYQNYEISAWTNNQPSHHNINYWHFGDYLGIGCGAHSKITHAEPFFIERLIKHKHPKAYMQTLLQQKTVIPRDELILEYIIGQFRTTHPLSFTQFEQRTQLAKHQLIHALKKAQALGLVNIHATHIELTAHGYRHHNDLCLSLLD